MIVSFTPGGGADLTARTVAQKMSEQMKQPVVVENRPGANGLDRRARSGECGARRLHDAPHRSRRARRESEPLQADAVRPDEATWRTSALRRSRLTCWWWIRACPLRRSANSWRSPKSQPGKINYASFGIASMAHLNLEAFKSRLGVDLVHVPYKGAGPAVQAVVAGDAGVTISSPAAVLGFVRDGRLRALAIGAPKRSSLLPDVPTLAEAGVDDDALASTYFALAARGHAAPDRRAPARRDEARASAARSERTIEQGGIGAGGGTGQELLDLVKQDIPRFRKLIDDIGIQPE